jgi:hypothetical protein
MTSTAAAVLRRLDARRELLMRRLDVVLEIDARGEGSTTWRELELIGDEMRHLLELYRELSGGDVRPLALG